MSETIRVLTLFEGKVSRLYLLRREQYEVELHGGKHLRGKYSRTIPNTIINLDMETSNMLVFYRVVQDLSNAL